MWTFFCFVSIKSLISQSCLHLNRYFSTNRKPLCVQLNLPSKSSWVVDIYPRKRDLYTYWDSWWIKGKAKKTTYKEGSYAPVSKSHINRIIWVYNCIKEERLSSDFYYDQDIPVITHISRTNCGLHTLLNKTIQLFHTNNNSDKPI